MSTQRQKRGFCLVTRRGSILAAFERKEMAQARKQRLVERGAYRARELRIRGFGAWIVADSDERIVQFTCTRAAAKETVKHLVAEHRYARGRLKVYLALEEVIRDAKNRAYWRWTTNEVRFRGMTLIVAALDKSP